MKGKVVFLFPGQGSQSLGMAQEFVQEYEQCDKLLREASDVVGWDIAEIMFGSDEALLNQTTYTQVTLLAAELCCFLAAKESGIDADIYVGFSLGEWAALVAAGVIEASDAFSLIQKRAQAMQSCVALDEGRMCAVIGLGDNVIDCMCSDIGDVWISNYNSPEQVTVAGKAKSVEELRLQAEKIGAHCVMLAVSVPSHCPLMRPAANVIRNSLEGVTFRDAQRPIVMNATGIPVSDCVTIRENIVEQLVSPVMFRQAIEYVDTVFGGEVFIEVGPGRVLSGLVKKIVDDKINLRVSTSKTLTSTLEKLL